MSVPNHTCLVFAAVSAWAALPGAACAQGSDSNGQLYRFARSTVITQAVEDGKLNDVWFVSDATITSAAHGARRVVASPGALHLDDVTYFHRDIEIDDISLLATPVQDTSGRIDPARFPFQQGLVPDDVLRLFDDVIADPQVFVAPPYQRPYGQIEYLIPSGQALIQVVFSPIWYDDMITGESTVSVSLLVPHGNGVDFDDATLPPEQLTPGLEFSADEVGGDSGFVPPVIADDGLEFTEDGVRDMVRQDRSDLLWLVACADRIVDCPPGLDPVTVTDMLNLRGTPSEMVQTLMKGFSPQTSQGGN